MTLSQSIPIACAVISALCAVFVAWRASRWRESDEAQKLIARVGAVEGRMTKAEGRLDGIDEKFDDLPTEADIARLEGEIGTVKELCRAAAAGVARIETFMMQRTS
ncbi:MAG: DUF2730 family protein [Caulobacter sp.]|nr:DUF2730 family protein [Caulobacter sp.]